MESHDSQEDSKHSGKDKQMSIGRKKFNMDPKKGTGNTQETYAKGFVLQFNYYNFILWFFYLLVGIEYLYENHLLKTDAQDVAQFLYKGEGLNKTAIGKQ